MATIPRTYLTTSKNGLSSVPLRNGQVISVWDNDEVWYDAPSNGERDDQPVRRKISGVRIVSTLPDNPMTDIVYVYIGDHGTLPETNEPIYDLRVWVNEEWLVVGNNWEDSFVKTVVSNDKFYLVGTPDLDETVGSLLKNSSIYVQDGKIYGNLEGKAHFAGEADYATTAGTATSASYDDATPAKPITGYLNGSVLSSYSGNQGTQLTFTKGDGTQIKVRTADTTYQVFTSSSAGLVDSTSNTVSSDSTDLLLSGSGWIDISNITLPAADSAENDGEGQNIAATYIKGLSYDTTTEDLTITYGDDDTDTVNIPDTTYQVFTTSTDGLVPAPSGAGEGNMFLRGDQTWQPIVVDDYTGASASTDGVHGLVPAALTGEQDYYLKGDGTWGTVFTTGINGLVPAPASADSTLSLKADGTWATCDDTQNTAGALNNVSNLLYLVGATAQNTSIVTNTNANIYVSGSKLYQLDSDASTPAAAQVVDVSSVQALTNKTYEGYTLGTACAATLASTVTANTNVPTNNAIISYVGTAVLDAMDVPLSGKVDNPAVAPVYDNTQTYAVDDWCTYDDMQGARLYRCTTAVTVAEDFDSTKWSTPYTVIEAIKYLIQNT